MNMRWIGNVTILAELGRGANSHIFRIRREVDGKEYALKVVPVARKDERKYLVQARREYRVGQMLDHPNLVRVHCLETDAGWFSKPTQARMLIEFVPGVPLNVAPPPSIGQLLRIFERVADAIDHMHARGVIHADIKPNNLILWNGSRVKVIDYGLARVKGEPTDRVQGTPAYMAPETAAHKIIDERTDLYNLGATMYRVATGRFPPEVTPGLPLTAGAFARLFHPVEEFALEIPSDFGNLIHCCLSFDPDRRPASAGEVRSALKQLVAARATHVG